MTADPFDLRCRRCHVPIDLPADSIPDDEYCSPTCRTAGPRRNPVAWFMAWARRVLHRAAADPTCLGSYDDPLAWTVDLRRIVRRDEERTLRDWLTLHGVHLRRIAAQPGLVEVCLGRHGAYLCVVLDTGEFRTRLVMAPPRLSVAINHRHLHADDIAEGPAA